MPRKRTRTDEILEELLNDSELERPLHGYELIRMVYAGRLPPGEYRYETEFMDGRKKIETFGADEDGRVKNLKVWIEKPGPTKSKSKKQGARANKTSATKRRAGKR